MTAMKHDKHPDKKNAQLLSGRGYIAVALFLFTLLVSGTASAEPASPTPPARVGAAEPNSTAETSDLRLLIGEQKQQLEQQQKQIDAQSALLDKLLRKVTALEEAESSSPPAAENALPGKPATAGDSSSLASNSAAPAPTPAPVPAQAAVPAEAKPDPSTFRAYWKQGLRFDTADKAFQLKVGGRIMNDWGFFAPSSEVTEGIGPLEDGTEFRRARLYVEGLLHKHVKFKAQYDFAGGEAGFRDVYIGLTKLRGVGNIMVGHMKEPFGLEALTSSKYITFLERSLPTTFAPERNTGIMFQNAVAGDKVTWAFGTFRDADGFGQSFGNGGYNYTGRITGRPWYEDQGRKVLHLGLAYRHGNPNSNRLRYRARPSAHLLPRFVDTKSFSATSSDTIGTEFAVVNGPASIQSEFTYSSVDRPTGQRENFTSFYLQGSYFLTGEHRVYKSSAGEFDRVKPLQSFQPGEEGGNGAWEIAARYARINLNDTLIQGGELQDFTFGVNWYLNPNTRFMWNYGWAERIDLGSANLFQSRFQVDF